MAKTHNAEIGQVVHLDPGHVDGPWTLNLPDTALDGATVTIKDNTGDTTAITVARGGTTATVEDPSAAGSTSNTSVTLNFGTINSITFRYNSGADAWFVTSVAVEDDLSTGGGAPEGTAVLSTGETGGTKFLREDGDGTCSWQTPSGSGDVTQTNTPVANDFARFVTQTSIEGRSYSEVRTDLGLVISTNVQAYDAALDAVTGTNTGDQTDLTGISDTKANFNTSCSDGTFLYVGDADLTSANETSHVGVLTTTSSDTVTNKDLTAETNKLRGSKTITVESPADGDRIPIWMNERAITILGVSFASEGGTSVLFNLEYATTIASGTVIHTDTCATSTPEWDVTPSGTTAIATDQIICLEVTTVTGTVNWLTITIEYDET